MAIKVRRAGVTSRYWYGNEHTATLKSAGKDGLMINFTIPSKGGGLTSIQVAIETSSFSDLASKMHLSSPINAKKAFDHALEENLK